jgi:hypothetical protein
MKVIHDYHKNELEIKEQINIKGIISANIHIKSGGELILDGTAKKNIFVEPKGKFTLNGILKGDLTDLGGIVIVKGKIEGDLIYLDEKPEVRPEAIVNKAYRLFRDHPLISTEEDLHGDILNEDEIRMIYESIEIPGNLQQQHDPTKPFVGKIIQKYLKYQGKSLNISCDVLIDENHEIKEGSGISPGIRVNRKKITTEKLEFLVDPLFIDIANLSNDNFSVVEFRQKEAAATTYIILSFIAGGYFGGILKDMGSDHYKFFKNAIAKIIGKKKVKTEITLIADEVVEMKHGTVTIKLKIDEPTINELDKYNKEFLKGIEKAKQLAEKTKAKEINLICEKGNCKIEVKN